MSLLFLILPIEGKPLLLYISTTDRSLGALLAQEDSIGKEREIYYIRRTLNGYEINYTSIEKSCLAIVFTTQQLRHYMLTHTIKLIAIIDPLKYLLSKVNLTRILSKWVMILSEFDIQYVDRKAIKGQAITLHIEFLDVDVLNILVKQWELYFDG
jgi:hypothetical protein